MGSLMAGWDSPVHDPKFASKERNKSLTKEEIVEFWKLRKKTEEEHLKAISPDVKERLTEEFTPAELKRSNSLPIVGNKNAKLKLGNETEVDLEALRNCWWTRSNWAFLNEPPVIEGEVPKYKYAAQYHIACLASPKPDTRVGSI
ncbi:Trans-4-hydroxy-L-proline dehydratase [Bienertia sinuspersici]